jgi:hypothetical protein
MKVRRKIRYDNTYLWPKTALSHISTARFITVPLLIAPVGIFNVLYIKHPLRQLHDSVYEGET